MTEETDEVTNCEFRKFISNMGVYWCDGGDRDEKFCLEGIRIEGECYMEKKWVK